MLHEINQFDETLSQSALPRRELAEVLERYLADLENGQPVDRNAVIAAHPELADQLRPYLDSLQHLHAATAGLRSLRQGPEQTEPAEATQQIGDYRIVREVGRGGMGVVYEAHQVSLNRPVALKILPFAAVLDQRQIARFRNEAQAAAQLHHPHIVPVFSVGQENGVYYYAMQYIEGQSLAEAVSDLERDQRPVSDRTTVAQGAVLGSTTTIDNRRHAEAGTTGSLLSAPRSIRSAEFFRSVARLGKEAADALQHAHEFGIIHRDVKPSNLLLDRRGKLWVTDFGLARIQSNSGVTLTGDVVGTLRYMSPEQASGQAALVDQRTDVYSLGVTLYELLTLQQAFGGEERPVVLQQIELDEPIAPRRINPAVPIDLETIILQAMAKSRDDRYPTAAALAEDLERFLAGQPALARRPGWFDRVAKWARRHRAVVGVAAIALAVLSAVSTAGLALLAREQARTQSALALAEDSAAEARENFARAEENYHRARDMLDQFGVGLADRLVEVPGTDPIRRKLLDDTLGYYGQFIEQAGDDPRLRHEAAIAHFKSGVIAAKLGDAAQADDQYRAAERLLVHLHEADPDDTQLESQLALVNNNLAILAAAEGQSATARDRYQQAIAIERRLLALDPQSDTLAGQLAESQANLAMLYDAQGEADAAESLLSDAVALLRPLAMRSDRPRYSRNLSIAANNLSYLLGRRDAPAAEAASREAIEILTGLARAHPGRMQYQDDLALCYNNLAALYSRSGRTAEAIDWHRRAVEVQQRLVRKAPAVVRYRSDLAISLNNLGVAHCRAGEVDAASEPFARARDLFSTLASDYPDQLTYRGQLAALLNNQALAWAGAGRHARAAALFPAAIDAQRRVVRRAQRPELMQELLNKMVYNQARSLAALGRWEEAAEAAAQRRELHGGHGERLFGVAVELAELARQAQHHPDTPAERDEIDRIEQQALATLAQAIDSGYRPPQPLATDPRFEHLQQHEAWGESNGAGAPAP